MPVVLGESENTDFKISIHYGPFQPQLEMEQIPINIDNDEELIFYYDFLLPVEDDYSLTVISPSDEMILPFVVSPVEDIDPLIVVRSMYDTVIAEEFLD